MFDFEKEIDGSKFYKIRELENLLAWPQGYILSSSINGKPRLIICIMVPEECFVCSVDISSINQGSLERFKLRSNNPGFPSPSIYETPELETRGRVVALVVDLSVLVEIEKNWSAVSQKFFSEAYILEEKYLAGSFRFLTLVMPKRLYGSDVPGEVFMRMDQSRAKYALYRVGTNIEFYDGAGYTNTISVPVKMDSLYVRGYDFITWFKKVGYFYTGNNLIEINSYFSKLYESNLRRDHRVDQGSPESKIEMGGGRNKSLSSRPIRMNDFRAQVIRYVKIVIREQHVTVDEVYVGDMLVVFNEKAAKGQDGFYFERTSVVGDKKDLFFRDSDGGKHRVTRKKAAECLKGVLKIFKDGMEFLDD